MRLINPDNYLNILQFHKYSEISKKIRQHALIKMFPTNSQVTKSQLSLHMYRSVINVHYHHHHILRISLSIYVLTLSIGCIRNLACECYF